MERMEAYREALKRRVCHVCLEQKDDGECGLADNRMCALELHLAYIVQAVRSVKSDRIADYAKAIRGNRLLQLPEPGRGRPLRFPQQFGVRAGL